MSASISNEPDFCFRCFIAIKPSYMEVHNELCGSIKTIEEYEQENANNLSDYANGVENDESLITNIMNDIDAIHTMRSPLHATTNATTDATVTDGTATTAAVNDIRNNTYFEEDGSFDDHIEFPRGHINRSNNLSRIFTNSRMGSNLGFHSIFEPRYNSGMQSELTYSTPSYQPHRFFTGLSHENRFFTEPLHHETSFDQFMTRNLIAEGQKDDAHKFNGNFNAEMLVALNIFKPINVTNALDTSDEVAKHVALDKCNCGIFMCSKDDEGVYSYTKCSCSDKIKICKSCAEELASNMIKCKGCVEHTPSHSIIMGFNCPTCRQFIQFK